MAPPPPARGLSAPGPLLTQDGSGPPLQFPHSPIGLGGGPNLLMMQALRGQQPGQQLVQSTQTAGPAAVAPGRRPVLLFRSTSLETGKDGASGRPRLVLNLDANRRHQSGSDGVERAAISPSQLSARSPLSSRLGAGGLQSALSPAAQRFQDRVAAARERELAEAEDDEDYYDDDGEYRGPEYTVGNNATNDVMSPNGLARARTLPAHIERTSGIFEGV
ncbi:hypothetical protein HDU93_009018 [Gonapodya sp. JEL0774]|nr:hypothetical protein HDU93_009018 [Gonapodya sp. JEL0774]